MGACTAFIFAALIEFTFVNYLWRKARMAAAGDGAANDIYAVRNATFCGQNQVSSGWRGFPPEEKGHISWLKSEYSLYHALGIYGWRRKCAVAHQLRKSTKGHWELLHTLKVIFIRLPRYFNMPTPFYESHGHFVLHDCQGNNVSTIGRLFGLFLLFL